MDLASSSSEPSKTLEHLHIEQQVAQRIPKSPIYAFILTPVQITSASKGHVVARLPLSQNHMNSAGSLHGSVSATIVDWMGGMAIATHDLRDKTGVSLDIHVTYQSGAKVGDEIEIEGIADKVGGSIAFTRVNIFAFEKREGGGGGGGIARGKLVASGTHTKYVKGTERGR